MSVLKLLIKLLREMWNHFKDGRVLAKKIDSLTAVTTTKDKFHLDLWESAIKKKEEIEGKDVAARDKFKLLMHKLRPNQPTNSGVTEEQLQSMSVEEYDTIRNKYIKDATLRIKKKLGLK